ncbi:MAG: bacillithiol biosynthesis cysteine-adding enzyme BshC [Cyclobacteriaceae bacterium]|nr:bacillithiol biosynthesis cysteine-adding enzyme BshC [Cyclobacteriaceae bacterium]
MYCDKMDLSETGQFPDILFDYLEGKPELASFYRYAPNLASFKECTANRNLDHSVRKVLVKCLGSQYQSIQVPEAVTANIKKLENKNTFTVTTGHQLNIFTGPLYFIFKIISVINTCRILKREYPDYDFVPVYWMASEDHDLEEISSFTLFGNTYTWETSQSGPVGRMAPASLNQVIDKLPEDVALFRKAYTQFNRLSDATRYYINELFGLYGLVVIDGDQRELKDLFKDIMKDDIINHHANDLVEESSSRLTGLGYGAQVYPRTVNLFYMNDQLRGRIVREQDMYKVLETNIAFSGKEILELTEKSPEMFSPNVILRPLYQERILPNIAYIGGPAEVAYWLQLKDLFKYYNVPFPILMPRNFAMIIGKSLNKKLKKLQISGKDLFLDVNKLKGIYLEKHSANFISLESEKKIMDEILESVKNKTRSIDHSLEGFIEAEKAKILKEFATMEKKLEKAVEKKHETGIRQVENLKEKLFPGGKLQERVENFLSFYLNDPDFISTLIRTFDPFDYKFNIIYEE